MESELDRLGNLQLSSLNHNSNCTAANAAFGDDGDEEEEVNVTLGFVEDLKDPLAVLRCFFPSKAGGAPAWLDPVNLPPPSSRVCGFCGDPLQFLLQIYAPLPENESTAFHRMIFVFMCPSMSCLLRDQHEQWKHTEGYLKRSVKVFRCQLPQNNSFYSSMPPRHDGTDKPLSEGAPLCSWCKTWKGDKLCSSCKSARYCSEKHQALHWQSGHRNVCRHIISTGSSDLKFSASGKSVSANILWPEYMIIEEEECISDSEIVDRDNSSSVIAPRLSNNNESMESVMDQFEADDDKKCWASFQERVKRAPEQVLRYCRERKAKPLWPLSAGQSSAFNIPPCPYCKGSLCYEFQIMPQLLYYFGVKNEADSLDWATIVVYTCLASCDHAASYKEEFAWVQLYPPMSK